MTRTHSWPEGHWNWPIPVTHKHGVRQGDLCFVGGQVDLDPDGNVLHAGDVVAQTPVVIASLGRVLEDLGSGLSDLVKIVVYHVDDGSLDESPLIEHLAAALPGERPAICTVPVPYLAYPGMLIEIEGVAAPATRRASARRVPRRRALRRPRLDVRHQRRHEGRHRRPVRGGHGAPRRHPGRARTPTSATS